MPETKTERLRRERQKRQKGLDYLRPYQKRLIQTIESLPEPKADPKNPTYPGRRRLAHTKLLQELPFVIERVAGDSYAEWALAGIMNLLGDLLPLDKDWQSMHVKNFATTEAQQIILEENARLEDEGARMYGRARKILSRNPYLEKLLSNRKDSERYVNDIKRKKYEK